jgi:hypothetical protein
MGQSLSPVVAAVSTMLMLHKISLSVMRIVMKQVAMKECRTNLQGGFPLGALLDMGFETKAACNRLCGVQPSRHDV